MLRTGFDALEVQPGVFKTAAVADFSVNNVGGGAALGFNHAGEFVARLWLNGATPSFAIVRGYVGSLSAAPRGLSTATGGLQTLYLNSGPARANEVFVLAGSGSGTAPGFPFGAFVVPLNPDAYFSYAVANPNVFPLGNSLGFLDANGRATATFTLPPGLPFLAGFALDHAYVTLDLAVNPTSASAAARVEFLP